MKKTIVENENNFVFQLKKRTDITLLGGALLLFVLL